MPITRTLHRDERIKTAIAKAPGCLQALESECKIERQTDRQDRGAGCPFQSLEVPGSGWGFWAMARWVHSRQAAKGRRLAGGGGWGNQAGVRPGSGGGADVGTWTLSGPCKPLSSFSKTNTQVQGWGTKWGRDQFGRYSWREASGRSDRDRKGLSLGSSSTLLMQPFSWLQGRKQNSPVHTPPAGFPPSVL